MNKKTLYLIYIFSALLSLIIIETIYLSSEKSMSSALVEKKMAFVELVGLPDLAISTEATFVRHRSLSDIFSIYKDDGTLREYFPSTYAISHSHIINPVVIKRDNEK
ncbi:MAG: hypothetical protein DRG78_20850 [Epsilonproteobacteria bacterium]|nr:MAG: hypothetical protein DRG78_20850 [Campylobacterota bacterium]